MASPPSPQLRQLVARARVAQDQRNYALAERLLREAISQRPDDAYLLSKLSSAVCEQRRYDEAADLARKSIALDPEYSDAHFRLTRALHYGERYEESLAPAYELIRLEPDWVMSYVTAAATLYELGRAQECLDVCERGLAIDGSHFDCRHFRALSLAQLKRDSEARKMVQEFIAENPGGVLSHSAAGWVYWWLGNADAEAEHHLRIALQLRPTSEWAHEGLGLVLLRRGDLAGARQHFTEALQLAPASRRSREALAQMDQTASHPDGTT